MLYLGYTILILCEIDEDIMVGTLISVVHSSCGQGSVAALSTSHHVLIFDRARPRITLAVLLHPFPKELIDDSNSNMKIVVVRVE